MGESFNAIRKELNHLHDAGYLDKVKNDNKVEYQANIKHPLFDILRKVVLKHLGLEDIVETVLERMGNVQRLFWLEIMPREMIQETLKFLIGKT